MNADTEKTMAIMALAENFGADVSQAMLKMWLALLKAYTVEQVHAGAMRVIETHEYKNMPAFAVLRKAIDAAAGRGGDVIEAQAAAEWTALLTAIEQRGSYGGPPPDMHPTTAYVLRSFGGWGAVCMWSTAWLDVKRRDFIALWIQAHGKTDAMALGADGVKAALTTGTAAARTGGAESAGATLGRLALDGQEVRQ